jgi:hypothetical protein
MNSRSAQFRISVTAVLMFLAATAMFLLAQVQTPAASITAVNPQTGVVTAKVNATGQAFQFTLNNRSQTSQLRVGQGVYANLTARQVSLDGRSIAGTVTNVASANGQAAGGAQPAPAAPLDGVRITSIDAAHGRVTVQLLATGQQIYFNVPSSSIQAHSLAVGQTVGIQSLRSLQMGGLCPCGQHTDGTCACACDYTACKVACKFGECRNGMQGPGIGVTTQTSGGSPVGLAAPLDGIRSPAAQVGRFTVATIQSGYAFKNLSQRLQSLLADGAKVQVTLDRASAGRSTVTGILTKVPGGFQVKTPERLSIQAPGAWLLIRGLNQHGTGEPPCGGCPRDAAMDLFEGDQAVCFCFASMGLRPGSGGVRPTAYQPDSGQCSGAPAK